MPRRQVRYFDGNYWRTQHWLISSRNPSLSSSRDAKNILKYKMPNQAASRGEARTKEEKSQRVTEMIYKEASRKSKLRMYFQLLPIFCSASYLRHNLFRKAFLNTSLWVKSWNRHLVLEQIHQRGSTVQRQELQTQDLTTMPQHTPCSPISTLSCALLLQRQLGVVYPLVCVTTELSVL